MKTTLIITAVLAVLIGVAGWSNQKRITSIREDQKSLQQEATRLGLSSSTGEAGTTDSPPLRPRPDREAAAKATAADIIAFAREMDAMKNAGETPADMERFQERVLSLMERMTSLDSTQLKALVTEFRNAGDLSDETRRGLIGFAVMTLAKDYPQTAIGLFTESSDLFPNNEMNKQMVSTALGEWAKKDPNAAMEWLRANREKHSDLINEQSRRGLLAGIAQNDPKMAFQVLSELSGHAPSEGQVGNGISSILQAARSSPERMAALEAFREYMSNLPPGEQNQQLMRQGISQLARNMVKEGYEATTAWITAANLAPEEIEAFSDELSFNSRSSDKGKWIQWMGETLAPEKSAQQIYKMVTQWTNDDYKAAGEWLVAAPDGPSKTAAVKAYAETVGPYEPEIAAQWALTLPPGKARDTSLQRIHRQLKDKNPEAAAAFAEQHGISPP